MIRKEIILGIFCCLLAGMAKAQTQPLTLEQAIATALQNNYDIQLSRNDSTVAALNRTYGDYAFYPTVNGNASYIINNSNQRQELKNVPAREGKIKSGTLLASANLNWTLFDGFRMFILRKRLNELVTLGELEIKNQVVTTVSDVMRTYYGIVRQKEQLKAIKEQMDLSADRLRIAQYKFDIGVGVKPDVLQAQIDLNAQRSNLMAQQTALERLQETLRQLLNVGQPASFTTTDSVINVASFISLDSVQNGVAKTNPQLLINQQNLRLADLTLQQRRAERFPTVNFSSAYIFNQVNNQNVINEVTQPLLNRNAGLNYGLTASIPILNGFATRRNIKLAQIDIQNQQLLYQRNLSSIASNITNAYKDYDLYKRTVALEESNMALVRENINIARERYKVGVATYLEMRIVEQSLADAQFRLIQARYNAKVAEIQLMQLRGDIVR